MRKREFRKLTGEIRTETINGATKIVGYGSVFNQLSEPMRIGNRTVRERVMPGAFDRCLAAGADIRGLVNHNTDMVLGRTASGTMRVSVDQHGLRYEIDPPDTSYARDLMVSLGRGDINQSSFGFYMVDEGYVAGEDGTTIRELREVDVFDCSPVAFPAYTGASSGLRAAEELRSMFPDGIPESLEAPEMKTPPAAEQREAKTKSVDGKDLHASDFAHVGDPQDPSTWKLPIHDADHTRNALARFNQVKGLSKEEKDAAYKKILAAAKKFGIEVSEENAAKLADASYRDAKKMLREIDPDGDGDDDEPLLDALADVCRGCSTVCDTANNALWTFWGGDPAYARPMLQALVDQSQALIDDINEAVVECQKELGEPLPAKELNARRLRYQKLFVPKKSY